MKITKYWIQKTGITKHKGALHRQLGIKGKIPVSAIQQIVRTPIGNKIRIVKKTVTVTRLLKRRANLANTLRKY